MTKDLLHSEVVRKAGLAKLKKYGRAVFSEMGKKGSAAVLKKYGKDYYKKLSLAGVNARKQKIKIVD